MKDNRCPECGQRLNTNYCDICMRKVPFGGVKLANRRDPWDSWDGSSAHREESGHKCITFDTPKTAVPKQTFAKPKTTFTKQIPTFHKRESGKKSDPKKATVVAVVLAILSLLPTVFSIFEDVHVDTPAPEYNVEAFAPEGDLPVLQPTVIYNDGEISVLVDSLGLYYDEPALSFIVDNQSDKDIDVMVEHVAVNGYMLDYGMSAVVDAGDSSQAFLSLYTYELEKADIKQIGQIDIRLRIYDRYAYDEIAFSETVIETEAADTYTQTVDHSGLELYNDGSVCIILRNVSLSGYGDGELELFVENLSGSDALVSVTGIHLNDQVASVYLGNVLLPNTFTIRSAYIYDLDELDIQELAQVEEVTMDIQVEYMNGWDVIETRSESVTFEPSAI